MAHSLYMFWVQWVARWGARYCRQLETSSFPQSSSACSLQPPSLQPSSSGLVPTPPLSSLPTEPSPSPLTHHTAPYPQPHNAAVFDQPSARSPGADSLRLPSQATDFLGRVCRGTRTPTSWWALRLSSLTEDTWMITASSCGVKLQEVLSGLEKEMLKH